MRETYKARGQANSATFFAYEGTSKNQVIKTIRQQTEAKRLPGYTSSWTVRRQDGTVVAAGGVDSDNIRYRIPDYYLDRLGKHY